MSDLMELFDKVDAWFEYGNFRVADDVLYRLLALFNAECEEKGLYRDSQGQSLTRQMRHVKNFHDLRDVLKLELDLVDFEESYQKLTDEQKQKVIAMMARRLFDLSKQMKTISTVSSDDNEMDDVSVEEKGISISYNIIHAGQLDERYRVLGYSFPMFGRHHFCTLAKEAKALVNSMADQNEIHRAMGSG